MRVEQTRPVVAAAASAAAVIIVGVSRPSGDILSAMGRMVAEAEADRAAMTAGKMTIIEEGHKTCEAPIHNL